MEFIGKVYKEFERPILNKVTREDFDVKKTYPGRTKEFYQTLDRFDKCFNDSQYSIIKTFIRVFWRTWTVFVLQKSVETLLNIFLPILIFRLYTSFNEPERSSWEITRIFSFILVINVVDTFLNERWWTGVNSWLNEFKLCFCYTLYRKSLRTFDCETSKEKLVNLTENDMWKFCQVVHITVRLPDQLARMISCYIYMFMILGPSAAVTIVAMFAILVPINYFGMKYAYSKEQNINESSDKRIKIITEVIKTIRFIKSYVWEDVYEEKIKQVRNEETTLRKQACFGWSFVELAWISSTFVLSSCSWIVYVWLGYTFSATVCFTIVTMSNSMAPQVFSLANSINEFFKSRLASKRVHEFMSLEEIKTSIDKDDDDDDNDILMFDEGSEEDVVALKFDRCSFSWKEKRKDDDDDDDDNGKQEKEEKKKKEEEEEEETKPVLSDISFQVKEGEFLGVTGPIGSGKTALAHAILGEMKCLEGGMYIIKKKSSRRSTNENSGIISLFSQSHWVRSKSVKENILFGERYDKERYDAVIHACCLTDDLKEFVDGDETLVGENGVTLSGGQKARVCLARMAYVEDSVSLYIADDPLKDLDEGVAAHVMENVFNKLLKDKTRILITHHIESLRHVQKVMILEKGRIVKTGPPQEILAGELVTPSSPPPPHPPQKEENSQTYGFQGFEDTGSSDEVLEKKKTFEVITIIDDDDYNEEEKNDDDSETKKSKKKSKKKKEKVVIRDKFDFKLLLRYVCDSKLHVSVFCVLVLSKFIFENLRDLGLGQWSSESENDQSRTHSVYYFILRDMFLGITTAVIVITSMVLFQGYMLSLSKKYHNKMLRKIFEAPSKWFDVTMSGEILSRFSSDINVLDNELRWRLREFIFCGLYVISSFFFVMYCCPMYLVVVLPLATLVFVLVRKYIGIFIKVTRLSTKEHAPVISHMNETNQGLVIVRAFQKQDLFCEEMKEKLTKKVKLNYLENDLCFWMATRTRWSMNLSILLFCVCCLLLNVNGIYVAMALSRLFDAQFLITWVLYLIPGIQKCLASLERIVDYATNLPSEIQKETDGDTNNNESMHELRSIQIIGEDEESKQGEIEFKNVMFKYDEDEEEYVLNDISFHVPSGSTLGIVGRTGSGKSTIVKVLFCLYEQESGEVYIHGKKKESWKSLKEMRKSIVYIAQNPTLLDGTLRQNLDLAGKVSDAELWEILDTVGLSQTFQERLNITSLDSSLEGLKLSAGEKQLLCFGRALVKKKVSTQSNQSCILVLDEATSACDLETDKKVQEIVRTCFKGCTIISIAHRLETIIQFDRVMAIDKGGLIVQNGKPSELLKEDGGLFFDMCKKTGRRRFEKLLMLASA